MVLILTSGALGSLLSILIGAYQTFVKRKDENRKRDTDDFFQRWMNAEDEVDRVRDENRELKDEIAHLKLQNKNLKSQIKEDKDE